MYSYGPPHMAKQKQDDQRELSYSSYVKTQDVILKTCRRRWMIGRSGERWSGISVLAARHDDDDDISWKNATLDLLVRLLFCNSGLCGVNSSLALHPVHSDPDCKYLFESQLWEKYIWRKLLVFDKNTWNHVTM